MAVLQINFTVQNGPQWNQFINAAIQPVVRLNKAVKDLADSIDSLNRVLGQTPTVSGFGTFLQDIFNLVGSQNSLGRGNLENLKRTASTLVAFVDAAATIDAKIAAGGFNNLSEFSKIMDTISSAFAMLDKIQRPENLVAIEAAVRAIINVINLLQQGIPSSGNIVTRWLKLNTGLIPLVKSVASAMTAFNAIQRPENLDAVGTAVRAITRVVGLLQGMDLNLGSIVKRALQLLQFKVLAKAVASAVKSFDTIKAPENSQAVATAINSLSRLIVALRQVAEHGDKLAIGGIRGFFTQTGSLLEGFKPFAKKVADAVKSFSKFDDKGVKSIEAAGSMIRSLVKLLNVLSTDTTIQGRGSGNLNLTFNRQSLTGVRDLMEIMEILTKSARKFKSIKPEQVEVVTALTDLIAKLYEIPAGTISVDTNSLRRAVHDLADIAADISRMRFDASKVSAISSLAQLDLSGMSFGGRGSGNFFSSLINAATAAASAITSTISSMVSTILSTLGKILTFSPFANIIRGAQEAGKAVADMLFGIADRISQIGSQMQNIGANMVFGGGIAGFIESKAVSLSADFESIMKQIEVLGGVVGEELAQSEALILRLGESSVFSATEVAAAFLDLSKAGLTVDQISVSMEDMLNLAAAGEISVADASNLVINAVGAMNLSFDDATMIVDTFVAAANVGVASVSDLAAAFGYVGNTMGAMGQELDITTAALTLMIDKGIDSTRAGTALDAFMRSLINPSKDAAAAISKISGELRTFEELNGTLTKMGISFEGDRAGLLTDAEGNYRDLNTVIKLVTEATKRWTEEDRVATLAAVAGSANAARAILALTGQYEDGTYIIDAYTTKQQEAASAADVGAALMDTFSGSVEELSGAFETLILKSVKPLLETVLRPLIDGTTAFIRLISKIPQPILSAVAAFLALGAILTTIAGSLLLIGGVILQGVALAFNVLGGAVMAVIMPLRTMFILSSLQALFYSLMTAIGLVIPLIVAFGGALMFIWDGIKSVEGQAAIERLQTAFMQLGAMIKFATKPFIEMASVILHDFSPALHTLSENVIANVIDQITNFINKLARAVFEIGLIGREIQKFFGFDIIGTKVTETAAVVTEAVDTIVQAPKEVQDAFADFRKFATSQAGFDFAKNFLVMNSLNYDEDIRGLRETFNAAKDAKREIDGFRRQYGLAAETVTEAIAPITEAAAPFNDFKDNLNVVFSGDFIKTEKFAELSAIFDKYADNPILKAIFGGDLTGQKLGLAFVAASLGLQQLSNNLGAFGDTFKQLLKDVGAGKGVQEAFDDFFTNFIKNTGNLSATLLEVGMRLLGGEGFGDVMQGVINDLTSGMKDRIINAFLSLGVLAIDYFITGFARRVAKAATLLADIIDRLFGTSFGDPVRKIATEFQRSVEIITSTFLRLLGIVNSAGATFGVGKKGGKFGFIGSAIAEALNLIGDAWKWFNDNILQFAANLILAENVIDVIIATLNAPFFKGVAQFLFGTNPIDMINNIKKAVDAVKKLADGIKTFISGLTGFLSGKLNLTDAFKKMFSGLSDIGSGFWTLVLEPIGNAILNAIKSILPNISWSDIKDTLIDSAKSALSFTGETIVLAWDRLLDAVTGIQSIDWKPVWDMLITSLENFIFGQSSAGTASSGGEGGGSKPISLNLSSIIGFTGFQSVVDAFTGEWALAEDAIRLLPIALDIVADVFVSIKNFIFGSGSGAGGEGGGGEGGGPDVAKIIGTALTELIRQSGYVVIEIAEVFFDMDRTKWRAKVDALVNGLSSLSKIDLGNIPVIGPIIDNFIGVVKRLGELDTGAIVTAITLIGAALYWALKPALISLAETAVLQGMILLGQFTTFIAGISISGMAAGALAFSVSALAIAGGIAAISGILKAIPEVIDALDRLASGDISGFFTELGNAIIAFWEGASEPVLDMLNFLGNLLGFENLFTDEKFQKGLDAWQKFFNDLYYLFLEKLAIPLGEKIQDLLSFEGLEVKGQTIVPGFKVELPGLEEAQQALEEYKASQTTKLTGEDIIDTISIQDTISAIAPEAATTIATWLTGKEDGPILGNDLLDPPSISSATEDAKTYFGSMRESFIDDTQLMINKVDDLLTKIELIGLFAPETFSPEAVEARDAFVAAAQERAGGGSVFRNKLYKVAEKGMSELLDIGGETYLIPGQNGTVIPAQDSSRSAEPSLLGPRMPSYTSGGPSISDNSTTVIEVNGSGLSADELRGVMSDVITEHNNKRTRTIQQRLRAAGRS